MGQQSVADVVHMALDSIELTGQNPLQHRYMGQVVHTLPKGPPVQGVTSLGEEVFLLRDKTRDQVEVYNVISYRLQRCLTVQNADSFTDLTSCEHHYCLYIANSGVSYIHRLDTLGTRAATQWPVRDKPDRLSVNKAHNVLVTCDNVRKIKEFSTQGDLLRELTLPGNFIYPWHAIQLTSGQFVVCHCVTGDPVRLRRVSVISHDGSQTNCSYGGQPDRDRKEWRPVHLAVDDNELVFVADFNNRRVELLTPTSKYVRHIVSSDKLKWNPGRLCLDLQRGRLYVAGRDGSNGVTGTVVVFSV